ncbi:MAG: hypothetical protein VKN72_28325 [Nostocales cyanobacterium 94392]|nr:hypothetical protein [Nostocales cyanobacterium 94392]
MHKKFIATVFILFSFMFASRANAVSFNQFFVFGDSLSETGNNLNTTTKFPSLGIPIIPKTPPYASRRFSYGDVWVDFVGIGKALGLTLATITALSKIRARQSANFAFDDASPGSVNLVKYSLFFVNVMKGCEML